ncbi:hypothetical protein JL722_9054 [Aureococcus anophagefferens]|nr:hypothetical protein JL722_9054 [Aureococcus anophagefferens]
MAQSSTSPVAGRSVPMRFADLPDELKDAVARFLDLAAVGAARQARQLLGDAPFRRIFEAKYGRKSLFRLKQPRPFTSYENLLYERAGARRRDLAVVPGVFRYEGHSVDRKGRVRSRGTLVFDETHFFTGCVRHARQGDGASLEGTGMGNLCADISPSAGKRLWALAWKERVERSVGAYTYVGALRHLPDGRLSWVGKFSWIGRERGAFSYVLERARDAAPGDGAPLSGDALARMAMASTAG